MHPNPRIAIFVSFSGKGGVERMIVNLSQGLIDLGCAVDLVLVKTCSEHLRFMPPGINLVRLGSSHTLGSLPALIGYLRQVRPDALLAAKDRANQIAVLARRFSGVPTRLVLRMGTTPSAALSGAGRLKQWLWYLPMRLLYPMADAIVAVSQGVADDMLEIAGLSRSRLHVIANPVVTPQIAGLAQEAVAHGFFGPNQVPVILGIGRLTRQKDFSTLMRAFARLRARRPCRLLILGEGRDRGMLESLARNLGIAADCSLPGFVANPYAYLQRSALFVLSSAWEGSPNALTEALALGVPVVAADCPSGPREILANGRYGPLVVVGDDRALARAMGRVLDDPPPGCWLKKAVDRYSLDASSRRYLDILLGPDRPKR